MKVGILTFGSAYNFGAILQCYALLQTVKSLGFDVKLIDYKPKYLATSRPTINIRTFINKKPWQFYKSFQSTIESQMNYDGYYDFVENNIDKTISVSNNYDLIPICNNFDLIIVGSDQVWNKRWNGNDDAWFGLKGKCSPQIKWITYAASAGDPYFSEQELAELKEKLTCFSSISVREKKLENLLKSIVNNSIPLKTVLDPSLLANPEIYDRWLTPIIDNPYIVIYQARESDYTFKLAELLAAQLKVKDIIPIDRYKSVIKHGYALGHYSPSQFISLIKNAKCVVTSSFHGTAFSIIFNTPFYTLRLDDGADERAYSLLSSLNLLDRFISEGSNIIFCKPDFSSANEKLKELRLESLQFLKESLC